MPSVLMQTPSDLSVPLAVAFVDVPGLSFPVTAGVTYSFEFFLLVVAGSTATGHTVAVNGPASPTYLRYTWDIPTSLVAVQLGGSNVYDHAVATPATSASQTATAPVDTNLRGVITPSVSGTVVCRIKPELAAALVVQRGSYGIAAWNG